MARPQLDTRQKDAVIKPTNLIVSASAGAGKTRVLVERIVKRCLEDHVSMERIVAVTFTEAAAGEMRQRIFERMAEELQQCSDPKEKEYIETQMIYLESATITTIDSLCKTILGKYYNVIGLNPAMMDNIVEGVQEKSYLNQAFEKAIQSFGELDKNVLSALEYSTERSEDYSALYEIVSNMISSANSSTDPLKWFEEAKKQYKKVKSISDISQPIQDAFFDYLRMQLEEVLYHARNVEQLALISQSSKIQKGVGVPGQVRNALETCYSYLEKNDYKGFYGQFDLFISRTDGDLKTPSDKKEEEYTEEREAFKDALNKFVKIVYEEKVFVEDTNHMVDVAHTMIDIAKQTYIEFQEIKKEVGCIDFADMERFAYEILIQNDYAVSKLYKAQFDEVMVDEFQDTSYVQNDIIELLAPENGIFRVGDVKQSIYSFRQAKPSLMRDLQKSANQNVITLEHNYRSKETLVQFANELFRILMNVDGCVDKYEKKDEVSIGNPNAQTDTSYNPVEVVYLINKDGEKYSAAQLKAYWIASQIQELAKQGVQYKDICILMRGHTDKALLQMVFEEAGIPYDIDARTGFFSSQLCKDVVAILKCIYHFDDEISLASVLTGPMYQKSDEELARMRLEGSISSVLSDSNHPDYSIKQDFEKLSKDAKTKSISELLTTIANHNDYYNHLSWKDQANFDFLFEKAVTFEKSGYSLLEFLSYIDTEEDTKSSDAMSKGKYDNVVSAITIHKSKGLEYPYVFVWSTSPMKDGFLTNHTVSDDELYFGMEAMHLDYPFARPSVHSLAISHKKNLEDIEENVRILYVALTRAVKKMYVVDTFRNKQQQRPVTRFDLNKRPSLAGAITMALGDTKAPILETIITEVDLPTPSPMPSNRKVVTKLPEFKAPKEPAYEVFHPSEEPNDPAQKTFELKPLVRKAKKAAKAQSGVVYGSNIHQIFEQLPNTKWTNQDLTPYGLSAEEKKRFLAFSDSWLYSEALNANELHKEYQFYYEDHTNEKAVLGVMDFAYMTDDKVVIIDFKTDHVNRLEELENEYRYQLNQYIQAMKLEYPQKQVEAYLWSFLHEKEIKVQEEK